MRRRTAIRALAATCALTLSLAACGRPGTMGTNAAPGITDTTITIGSSFPLSGPLAANGIASKGAAVAFFESVNADGGVRMTDGKARKVKFVFYDDGFNPVKAVQNYGKLVGQDQIFALFQTFGTPTNVALMKKANLDGVPEAYVNAGDTLFSNDRTANPWTIGWQPTYQSEGLTYGKYLAAQGKPLTVAVLRQADSFGEAYLAGLEEGIKGSPVTIAKTETYTATDATVDSQISSLAATHADVLYLGVVPQFVGGAVNHALTLGWKPSIYLASVSSSISQVVNPAKLTGYPGLYTTSFVKRADDPQWAADPGIVAMTDQMKKYAPEASPAISNAPYTYSAAAAFVEALKAMKGVERKDLMDSLNTLKTADIGVLLPGIGVDGTDSKNPPVSGLKLQHFEDGAWKTAG